MNATRFGKILRATSALTPAIFAALAATSTVNANPKDGVVTAGEATISEPDPKTVEINQSTNRAIIEWRSFDIEANETTRFIQPNSESWTLNRVVGSQDPSRILGTLEANGNVVVVNPDGVHFGPGSRADVNRLIATTADIGNDNFMSGNMVFDQPGNPSASIVNEGTITAKDYGLSALVAPAVRNSGIITARLGQINLSSGNTFTIDPYGDGLVKLGVDDEITTKIYDVATGEPVSDLVKNDGRLEADGGTVAMTAATTRQVVNSVVNNTGVIEARSVGMRGGKIILGGQTTSTKRAGAPSQTVRVSGKLNATSYPVPTRVAVPVPAPRGHIQITGEVILAENAEIDASGRNGGGTVLIGGDYLGGNASDETLAGYGIERESGDIPTSRVVALNENVSIRADATENGDGGKVVVWSDETTLTAATITARGGEQGGDGGFVETSGKYLDVRRSADASARNGSAGTWLLDPLNTEIDDLPDNNNTVTFQSLFTNISIQGTFFANINGNQIVPSGTNSVIDKDTIEASLNAGTSVAVRTHGTVGPEDGDIFLRTNIQKTGGGDAIFNLSAVDDIIIDPGVNVTSTSNKLHFSLFATQGEIVANNIGEINVNGGTFIMDARDGISVSSAFDMPNDTTISLRSGVSPLANVPVSVQFDGDSINFFHNNATLFLGDNSIQLLDGSANSSLHLHLDDFDVSIADNAIDVSNNRVVTALLFHDPNFFVTFNNVPEISSNGTINLQFNAPGAPALAKFIEVDAANTPICNGLTCVPVAGAPAVPAPLDEVGQAELDPESRLALLNEIEDQDGVGEQPPLFSAFTSDESGNLASALRYAEIAAASYSDSRNTPSGYVLADSLAPYVPGFKSTVSLGNGLYANVYEKRRFIDGKFVVEIVVAFRGTERGPGSFADLIADVEQIAAGGALLTSQYNAAAKVASDVALAAVKLEREVDDVVITLTGHSLGGGLAQYAGALTRVPIDNIVTFNSAGLSDVTLRQINALANNQDRKNTKVVHVRSDGDVISSIGSHLPGDTIFVPITSTGDIISRVGSFLPFGSSLETSGSILSKYQEHKINNLINAMKHN